MLLLRNPIQDYAWGPIDGIARLAGTEPTGGHEAELWIGTHPRGPSVVAAGEHEGRTLAEVIADDPHRWLGDELADTGLAALPFLLKVLAIGAPLSLQAHPSAEQARAGFAREEAAGIPVDGPDRNYRDRWPKPEMLVALDDTWVLSGFRRPDAAADLVAALGAGPLDPLVTALRIGGGEGLRAAVEWLLRLEEPARTEVAAAAALAAPRAFVSGGPDDGPDGRADAAWWVARLADDYPGDPTCVAPLLLVLQRLAPGDRVVLPAGNLHAYLEGAGVEIMAASDNVLRGGLTPKHIDVAELLRVLRFTPLEATTAEPAGHRGGQHERAPLPVPPAGGPTKVRRYDPDQPQFGLVRVDPIGGPTEIAPTQPSLLLALGGDVDLAGPDDGLSIGHGDAAYAAPGEGPIVVSGPGTLWWATTRAGLPAR